MESNRYEALRAKETAEKKFKDRAYKTAKKYALGAYNLCPELDGISSLLTTLDVYISAEEDKVRGESNWYSVLGVTRLADDETIRKQYRKLALLLHPDKNKIVGAEGAFQLVSQAWSVLSDKSRRIAYDKGFGMATNGPKTGPTRPRNQKMNPGHAGPSTPRAGSSTPHPPNENGRNPEKTSDHQSKGKKVNPVKKGPPCPPPPKKERTFWTVCHKCKMQYEYLRMYRNQNLLCPNCHEAYFAIEIDPPSKNGVKTSHQPSNSQNGSKRANGSTHWVPFTESTSAASAAKAANMVQQAYEKVKLERQKAQAAARKEEALKKKLASKRASGVESSTHPAKRRKGVADFFATSKIMNNESKKSQTTKDSGFKLDSTGQFDYRQYLAGKACDEIRKKLFEPKDAPREKVLENIAVIEKTNKYDLEQTFENVQDSDFHNFDKDRTGNCFSENQVWAVYNADDSGMPSRYAVIHSVISLNPFKVSMSWLDSITFIDGTLFRAIKTCGEFRISKAVKSFTFLDSFSHIVKSVKPDSRTVQIFPQRREIWVLFKNWSSDWNELTEYEEINKYEIVEILGDYEDELGVIVIPLVKVAGFKAVFHHHFDAKETKRIRKGEMGRFSHCVPSHMITKSCYELDPAALPSELLEVLSKTEDDVEYMKIDEDVDFVKSVEVIEV